MREAQKIPLGEGYQLEYFWKNLQQITRHEMVGMMRGGRDNDLFHVCMLPW